MRYIVKAYSTMLLQIVSDIKYHKWCTYVSWVKNDNVGKTIIATHNTEW